MHGLDIGPEQLIEQQKTDQTLKKYWELAENPVENGMAQFFVKMKSYTESTLVNIMEKG